MPNDYNEADCQLFVLLHFWSNESVSNDLADLTTLKVVVDRFGNDDRFTTRLQFSSQSSH